MTASERRLSKAAQVANDSGFQIQPTDATMRSIAQRRTEREQTSREYFTDAQMQAELRAIERDLEGRGQPLTYNPDEMIASEYWPTGNSRSPGLSGQRNAYPSGAGSIQGRRSFAPSNGEVVYAHENDLIPLALQENTFGDLALDESNDWPPTGYNRETMVRLDIAMLKLNKPAYHAISGSIGQPYVLVALSDGEIIIEKASRYVEGAMPLRVRRRNTYHTLGLVELYALSYRLDHWYQARPLPSGNGLCFCVDDVVVR